MKTADFSNDKTSYLLEILVPGMLLLRIRDNLNIMIASNKLDNKYKSLAYHLVWIYSKMLMQYPSDTQKIFENIEDIVDSTISDLVCGLADYINSANIDVPKQLKN